MKTEDLEEILSGLGFVPLEAKIYLVLLRCGNQSAYQIAKEIEISRPSIYNALEHMVHKGFIEQIPNPTALYKAVDPEVLLKKLQNTYLACLENAERELEVYQSQNYNEQFANLQGKAIIVEKICSLIRHSQTEIYINTDMNLDLFKDELQAVVGRKVRVVLFSFYKLKPMIEGIEVYTHGREMKGHSPTRFMIVSDQEQILISDLRPNDNQWLATVTDNRLMVKIISEHIHNDIYLLNIRNRYGKGIYEDYLHIHTAFEERERGVKL